MLKTVVHLGLDFNLEFVKRSAFNRKCKNKDRQNASLKPIISRKKLLFSLFNFNSLGKGIPWLCLKLTLSFKFSMLTEHSLGDIIITLI